MEIRAFFSYLWAMATTGELFDKLWLRRVDKPYNSYYSTIQRERLYKQALFYALEYQYNNLVVQGQYDEIRSMVNTDYSVTPADGVVHIPTMLPNYLHYLFSKAKYRGRTFSFAYFTYSGEGSIKAYTDNITPLRTGNFVAISGCADMNEANGNFYLKKLGMRSYGLYQDENLSTPATSTVFHGGSASATEYFFGNCMVQFSDQKVQVLDSPTRRNPVVFVANNSLKIEPPGCLELVIDYITKPPVFINPVDNVFDLETIYPMKFLYQIIDKAAEIFDVETRDPQGFQQDTILENTNQ